MNSWLFAFLTVFGPPLAVMCAMALLEPDNGIPEPFWDIGFGILLSSLVISTPQFIWMLICLPGLLSREVYWGGLIAVQVGLIAYGVWGVLYVRSHPGGDSIWFLYFPLCVLLIPFGAFCGFLFRKFSSHGGAR